MPAAQYRSVVRPAFRRLNELLAQFCMTDEIAPTNAEAFSVRAGKLIAESIAAAARTERSRRRRSHGSRSPQPRQSQRSANRSTHLKKPY